MYLLDVAIYLVVVIIVIILLFLGYPGVKKAYASELNEVYTIEEIYDMYDISEDIRVNPKGYGYERVLIVVSTVSHTLDIVCFDEPFDLNNIYNSGYQGRQVRYLFDETIRYIQYNYQDDELVINEEKDTYDMQVGEEPFMKQLIMKIFTDVE